MLWPHIMLRLPLWTAQAHFPTRSALDTLREEEAPAEDEMAMGRRNTPPQDKKKA